MISCALRRTSCAFRRSFLELTVFTVMELYALRQDQLGSGIAVRRLGVERSSDLVEHGALGYLKPCAGRALMNEYRTYWNTHAQIKPGDKYIQITLSNAGPKPIVTRNTGEVLEGLVITTCQEESIECASLDRALREAERLCEEAVRQGYRAYLPSVHGGTMPEHAQAS